MTLMSVTCHQSNKLLVVDFRSNAIAILRDTSLGFLPMRMHTASPSPFILLEDRGEVKDRSCKCLEQRQDLELLFKDMMTAFDTDSRPGLWSIL
ncbi:hypothetical protein ACOMHN_009808 [Nucella lapillus]